MNEIKDVLADKMWIFKCEVFCSKCPINVGKAMVKNSEEIKHLIEGAVKGQTNFFNMKAKPFRCPLCKNKWGVAGNIPQKLKALSDWEFLACFTCSKPIVDKIRRTEKEIQEKNEEELTKLKEKLENAKKRK